MASRSKAATCGAFDASSHIVVSSKEHWIKAKIYSRAGSLALLWLAVFAGSGVDFFRLSEKLANTALKPSWMPRNVFLRLVSNQVYLPAAYLVIPLLVWTGLCELTAPVFALRLSCALCVTAFQLGDSCRTTSHRDYLMLYICWILVIPSDTLPQAVAYGLSVLYILSSGVSKAVIGGSQWAAAGTMSAILTTFARKTPKQGGPILLLANRKVRQSPAACAFLASLTLLFEILLAPLGAFFLAPRWRFSVGLGLVTLHLGIGAIQSGAIGAFFLPNVAAYVLGFGCFQDADLSVLSSGWCVAVAVCFVPLGAAFACRRSGLIQEDWPFTPFALFPWNGQQWNFLHESFVESDTRLVSPSADVGQLLGCRVIPIEHRSDVPLLARSIAPEAEELVLYDLWSRTLGITTYQDIILEALKPTFAALGKNELQQPLSQSENGLPSRLQAVADATCKLLQMDRVVELSTGKPLRRCLLVRVDAALRVKEVILEGQIC
ncbi:unnamed protein product [Effrenium voratum]|nr:unnamed protein product [Effrenium voratum]